MSVCERREEMTMQVATPIARKSSGLALGHLNDAIKQLNECQCDADIQALSQRVQEIMLALSGDSAGTNVLEALEKAEKALKMDGQTVKCNRIRKMRKLLAKLPSQSAKKQRKMLRQILSLCSKNAGVSMKKRGLCGMSLCTSVACVSGSVLVLAGATALIAMAATGDLVELENAENVEDAAENADFEIENGEEVEEVTNLMTREERKNEFDRIGALYGLPKGSNWAEIFNRTPGENNNSYVSGADDQYEWISEKFDACEGETIVLKSASDVHNPDYPQHFLSRWISQQMMSADGKSSEHYGNLEGLVLEGLDREDYSDVSQWTDDHVNTVNELLERNGSSRRFWTRAQNIDFFYRRAGVHNAFIDRSFHIHFDRYQPDIPFARREAFKMEYRALFNMGSWQDGTGYYQENGRFAEDIAVEIENFFRITLPEIQSDMVDRAVEDAREDVLEDLANVIRSDEQQESLLQARPFNRALTNAAEVRMENGEESAEYRAYKNRLVHLINKTDGLAENNQNQQAVKAVFFDSSLRTDRDGDYGMDEFRRIYNDHRDSMNRTQRWQYRDDLRSAAVNGRNDARAYAEWIGLTGNDVLRTERDFARNFAKEFIRFHEDGRFDMNQIIGLARAQAGSDAELTAWEIRVEIPAGLPQ